MKKVIIAGGTGFIGEFFQKRFQELGYDVSIISRQKQHIHWEDRLSIQRSLEGAELLINLAGKSVNCRYNETNKQEIMNSRVATTKILGEAVQSCSNPPELWINSSTATIYRHAEDRPMTEAEGEIGLGFSVDVATKWEETFFSYKLSQTRQIALRIAIVLGKGGGVMTPYRNLVRFGLGGIQGSGKQMFSWIHIEDLFQIILFVKDRKELSGVFNCSAPQPVTNRELMNILRHEMNAPLGLPAPKWMLKIGSVFIRTETELVLKSRWVIPDRLEREGYNFRFKTLDHTLQNILHA
ncbi:TIGR01777 family oxidoreductase [Terribacillus saccharophilus]|uniref:TIGR01777 family protein n=1 Tax=Terribacillus saccharophilus TaxID=361277 RepID=A0A268A971_9BACI|nr:TIGR01777 family oxidoreductase [Terribacillus saccharophilus]PAD20671.1 TIGR01777 family protein [Terribacillus saccharophilus]PAF16651.1 TIGR01777 family protein [Terribacillus saccharophilus]PAF21294.1 TIGR01777 family protein [Terribacillus saccharophilus]PAF34240.1 TIGR01777 family protein [Terribacillus saccharophilus]